MSCFNAEVLGLTVHSTASPPNSDTAGMARRKRLARRFHDSGALARGGALPGTKAQPADSRLDRTRAYLARLRRRESIGHESVTWRACLRWPLAQALAVLRDRMCHTSRATIPFLSLLSPLKGGNQPR